MTLARFLYRLRYVDRHRAEQMTTRLASHSPHLRILAAIACASEGRAAALERLRHMIEATDAITSYAARSRDFTSCASAATLHCAVGRGGSGPLADAFFVNDGELPENGRTDACRQREDDG